MVSLRFLLDTNILSEPLRSRPNPHVVEMLRRHENQIATATIVWHELLFGCNRLPDSKKRQTVDARETNSQYFFGFGCLSDSCDSAADNST